MNGHVSPPDLETFAADKLPKEKARALFSHLLAGCEICQREAAAYWCLDGQAEPVPESAYDRAIDRAFAAVERELLLQQVSLAA